MNPQIKSTILRFPLSILSSALTTVLFIFLSTVDFYGNTPQAVQDQLGFFMEVSFCGILLFSGLAIVEEYYRMKPLRLQLWGIPVLYLIFSALHSFEPLFIEDDSPSFLITAVVIALGSLAMMILSFKNATPWSAGKGIFMRALNAIAAGFILSGAFMTIEFFLNIHLLMQEHRDLIIWSFFCFFAANLIFLGSLPKRDDSKDTANLWEWTPYLAIPALALYFDTLIYRMQQHGMTENRYFAGAIGTLFTLWTLYYLLKKKPDWTKVLLSLVIMLALGSFGPWGARPVSLRSQTQRLENLLKKHQSTEDRDEDLKIEREIQSVLLYLEGRTKKTLLH